jgi:glycyl-tRNA synthetase beta chain
MNQTLLVELQTEELPPKALVKLGAAFAAGIANGLKARDFLEPDSVVTPYATPRRLAVSITRVRATSPDKSIREKVLPVSVALDKEGNPSAPRTARPRASSTPIPHRAARWPAACRTCWPTPSPSCRSRKS